MVEIGVDIGGTFTDCVLRDGVHCRSAKVLSVRSDPAAGVLAGIEELARASSTDVPGILARCRRFAHGTTIGTNAVLERNGARVGLVATAGHGDALGIMRGHGRVAGRGVEDIFQVRGTSLPVPLIVPGAVLELQERVDAAGNIVVALDEQAAAVAIIEFVERHALEALAVALLWSFANPLHEQAVAAMIRKHKPDVFVSLSCEVSPRLGEYERTVAAVVNAYIGPSCTGYLDQLGTVLAAADLNSPLLAMQSNGGLLPASAVRTIALGTLDSGPVGGLSGVVALARASGDANVIATDMGGTSFDIGLVVGSEPVVETEAVIDQYTYRLPHLDVRTTACGGGTVARCDPRTGGLVVGPHSAGADPGPACYGRGGTEATVTDADVVLGLLRPDGFLDGRMSLDAAAARSAVGRLAELLGVSLEDAAAGIVTVNNLHAATLIRQQTLERGLDPRDFVLYAYGGAGPLHAFGYAAEIGVKEVVVPLGDGASTLSAYGIASSDLVRVVEIDTALRAPLDATQLEKAVDEVIDRCARALADSGVTDDPQVEVWALMRYQEQLMHSLEVPVQRGAEIASAMMADFSREYALRYGLMAASAFEAVEVFALRARARVASHPGSEPHAIEQQADIAAGLHPVEVTSVLWPAAGTGSVARLDSAVYRGDDLPDSATISGPALVELAHTTVAVPTGASLRVEGPNLRLFLEARPASSAAPGIEGDFR